MSKVLTLTLKKKWFDMIASGEKKEEYREVKPYWFMRLVFLPIKVLAYYGVTRFPISQFVVDMIFKHHTSKVMVAFNPFDTVIFRNGYSANAPTITVQCLGISIGTAKPEWSDNWQGQVFVIKLGEIIKPQTT